MLELALVACLADDPTRCKDVALIFSEEAVTPMQCLIGAQPQIAKWSEGHPRWVVKKWACRPAGRIAKI
jgi:hypothetical protein